MRILTAYNMTLAGSESRRGADAITSYLCSTTGEMQRHWVAQGNQW